MPDFEFEFNQQDRDLILDQLNGALGSTNYVRLTIYPSEGLGNIVTLPDNTNGIDGKAIFFSTLDDSLEINISPFKNDNLFDTRNIGGLDNDFKIYKNETTNDIYIKPNEIFNTFGLPEGNYRIQIDFLKQINPQIQNQTADIDATEDDSGNVEIQQQFYQFIIKQVSTSRKEVRLKILNQNIVNDSNIILQLTNEFNNFEPEFLEDGSLNPNYKYQFKHILNIGTGDHNPIMNYAFDRVTDGKDNQSIILKLYEPLSGAVGNLSMVTIEREVLTTQLQDIFYFSDVPDVFFGDGLEPEPQENWINPDNNDFGFQSLDELAYSASIGDIEIDSLISSSEYNYPNLNTDFNEFTNHTFFGSAKKKLQNFNKKVQTIQGYYSDISESLAPRQGGAILGDSTFLVQKRKDLFNKINDEFKTFTPYERFLYFDGQSESTSSVPGLGKNYANINPLSKESKKYEELNQKDGFNIVYKNSNAGDTPPSINISKNLYKVQNKPFFNYSGSVYFSFLMKGTDNLEIIRTINNNSSDGFESNGFYLPHDTLFTSSILQPSVTGSEYKRFIYKASASYFIPNTRYNDMADLNFADGDFDAGSSKITILTGSLKTGSYKIKDTTGLYPTTVVSHSSFDTYGNVINGIPFKGSIMPAGDLFSIEITSGSALTQSFITDVKVTLNDPSDVLPFDMLYHTSSTNYTNWYNDMLTKAETFDTNNIHSFENNLPVYIQNSSDYQDMKDFLNLQGEQYDLIRNHIDSMGTIHKRGYKKTNSPPNNTLPMLLSNMGWQAINPFTGSLTETLGSYLSGVTSIDDIKNNTWRKTLNNLLYIYKSKGTKNSVRALLNTYGYPPDVLEFQEFGGATSEGGDLIFDDLIPSSAQVDLDLNTRSGSFSFTKNKSKIYNYNVNGRTERVLQFDWYYNNANINTIEFVYKHVESTNEQLILVSRANALFDQNNWDLRVVPSSDGASSSFAFRLNNSETGSLTIASNALSMSTNFSSVRNGQLWNVMLQRMTASSDSTITNEYRLHAALQEDNKIKTYNYVTMSVSGSGVAADTNTFANANFIGTGSRAAGVAGNLHVGGKLPTTIYDLGLTGSISEIKAWSTPLSISKFRQHTLNKFSTVGNSINSHKDELIYHFKLNENYTTASVSSSGQNLSIIDSAPTTTYSDYSITKTGNFFTGSIIYGFDFININKLSLQDNVSKRNDNNILINPNHKVVGNLSSDRQALESLTNPLGKKPQFNTSPKLELYRSPQTYVDNFILDKITGFNLETLYGNPTNYYSQSYDEFVTFRENFFDAHPITVDVNKFIRAHENMFNDSIIEGLKQVVPARSTFSDKNSKFGVEIKQTILEKQKYEHHKHSVETNPNTITGSTNPSPDLSNSEFVQPKSGSVGVSVTSVSTYEQPKSASISVNVTNTTTYERPKSGSINSLPSLNNSTYEASKNGTIDYASIANESYSDVHKNWGTSSADVQHINFAGGTGSYGTFNTYDIEKRFVFHSIGDCEYYSASKGNTFPGDGSTDLTLSNRFYNQLQLTDGTYASSKYVHLNTTNSTVANNKHQVSKDRFVIGKRMGKTRFMRYVAKLDNLDGNNQLILPRNHVTKFSYPFKEQMINGTKNTNPGFLNVQHEDYSSASFYAVKVTGGENQIYVKGSNNPTKGGDDKIIY